MENRVCKQAVEAQHIDNPNHNAKRMHQPSDLRSWDLWNITHKTEWADFMGHISRNHWISPIRIRQRKKSA